ncbi:unnamed protein product [Eruca vesicaria subsp. sativa]|uniref:P-type ATPase A domain-containing protein n=1 Tax=Eruca vesicaria subsp. sativa TaxID=29727 RepID=A0ABC8M2U9_ERUVS|nr:unnamed protein product [Eruca vesicaria subsp. sativa]
MAKKEDLVPGNIVEIGVGDKVPPYLHVVALISSTLRVEQDSLAGEREAVSKTTKRVEENSDIQEKRCMVFAGSTFVNGNCICLVTYTSISAETGRELSQI